MTLVERLRGECGPFRDTCINVQHHLMNEAADRIEVLEAMLIEEFRVSADRAHEIMDLKAALREIAEGFSSEGWPGTGIHMADIARAVLEGK